MLEQRDPLSVIAAIGVAVAITKGSADLVVQLRRLIAEIQGLVGDIQSARRAVVESDGGDIELAEDLSDDDLELIAQSAA